MCIPKGQLLSEYLNFLCPNEWRGRMETCMAFIEWNELAGIKVRCGDSVMG
jgi:hypothetical protein